MGCSNCHRDFQPTQGIWNLLPVAVANQAGKDKERQGWAEKDRQTGEVVAPEHWLTLPHQDPHPYYRAATHYLRITMQHAKPWQGMNVLELGAAECWASRHFAEAGAHAFALDYDSSRMLRAQIILDQRPVQFLRVNGDAERLPFGTGTMDRVFCCSVLHHFFDLPAAIKEISRVLKPGGMFIGIHEAYHPPYYSKKDILSMSEDTIPFIQAGINEQSYTPACYRKYFAQAGMRTELLHPAWDSRESGDNTVMVKQGIGLDHPFPHLRDYLRTSRGPREAAHRVAGYLLRLGLWCSYNSGLFRLLRFQILNWTTRDKILVAHKPVPSSP
jgi:ubiquinone/menaquinone biosynthesis C-methylase UbiE